eukprot:GHUV01057583.1.p1 GENE.GHUV01057583.1~~GHUV01057583.1.p1  ORF type:complete len:154 (+),score=39.11 GHUV01057583.1:659-1120(+)
MCCCYLTVTGIAENSHLRKNNYFYYNCVTGHFLRENCPSYLLEHNYNKLHDGLIQQLTISTRFFLDELRARKYTKVILMDHVDWLDEKVVQELATTLAQQVLPGGIVIWRSASLCPPYAKVIADAGFSVTCISRASEGYMDRVRFGSFVTALL